MKLAHDATLELLECVNEFQIENHKFNILFLFCASKLRFIHTIIFFSFNFNVLTKRKSMVDLHLAESVIEMKRTTERREKMAEIESGYISLVHNNFIKLNCHTHILIMEFDRDCTECSGKKRQNCLLRY